MVWLLVTVRENQLLAIQEVEAISNEFYKFPNIRASTEIFHQTPITHQNNAENNSRGIALCESVAAEKCLG